MMKKLLLMGGLFCLSLGLQAQQMRAVSASTVISDTLHYYLNKQYFKLGTPLETKTIQVVVNGANTTQTVWGFPFYKAAAATVTNISHLGNRFENKDTAMIVDGLEGWVARNPKAASPNMRVVLYLCNIGSDGFASMPPLDSVVCNLSGLPTPSLIGGPLIHGPRNVRGDFAVLIRNMQTIAGDTVRIFRTDSKTYTNTTAPQSEKFSDSYGMVRYFGKFYAATNFTTYGFGVGSDYEFCLAPRVTYTLYSEQAVPGNVNKLCTQEPARFVNKSSWEFSSRFFNLIEFNRKWNQNTKFHFNAVPAQGISNDSSVYWFFEMEDNVGMPGPRLYLPYNATPNSIDFKTDSALNLKDINGDDTVNCYPANQFRTRWRGMVPFGNGRNYGYSEDFVVCTSFCNRDAVGLPGVRMNGVSVFPNPTDSKVYIRGLEGTNKVTVIDVIGQVILTDQTSLSEYRVDLSSRPSGAYFVRITGASGGEKIVRVLKQ